MTTLYNDEDLLETGRDDWLLAEDENKVYDLWVSDEGYLLTPISVVSRHNFMVFRVMKEYIQHAHYSPTNILAIGRAKRRELHRANVDTESVACLDRWVTHIDNFLAVYEQERRYVNNFIMMYPNNNEIAQDTKAQEIFLRFYGGSYFYSEDIEMCECGFMDAYIARGSSPIYQHKLQDTDITG
jgi:hypothetical protein